MGREAFAANLDGLQALPVDAMVDVAPEGGDVRPAGEAFGGFGDAAGGFGLNVDG